MKTQVNPSMHIGLHVRDLNKTVNFYRTFLRKEPVKVESDYAKFELTNPALVISFIKKANPTGTQDFGHLGIRVSSDEEIEDWKNLMENAGVGIREEKEVSCCYAIQNKFWVEDPDGYQWEVYRFLEDTAKKEKTESCCA